MHLPRGLSPEILMWMMRRSPSQEGVDGNPEDSHLNPLAPSTRRGCRTSYQYPSHQVQLGIQRINTFNGKAILGKIKVSFEQWYHEVQCIKDHCLESVVQESIVKSLKGALVDMTWYMGPTTSMAHILQKLTIIFSPMASFDILMQNFYKVTQGNHENVPSCATRLEGTLNQIRLQCPRRVTDLEAQQHLKDHLFRGIHKHIRDSIRYLHSNSGTTYFQLMIAACKGESENEEACDKVRARSAMTTDPVEGTTELGYQIAKLMAVLTRAGQQPSQHTK